MAGVKGHEAGPFISLLSLSGLGGRWGTMLSRQCHRHWQVVPITNIWMSSNPVSTSIKQCVLVRHHVDEDVKSESLDTVNLPKDNWLLLTWRRPWLWGGFHSTASAVNPAIHCLKRETPWTAFKVPLETNLPGLKHFALCNGFFLNWITLNASVSLELQWTPLGYWIIKSLTNRVGFVKVTVKAAAVSVAGHYNDLLWLVKV